MGNHNQTDIYGPCLLFLGKDLSEPWQLYQVSEKEKGYIIKWTPVIFPTSRDADKVALESAERLFSIENLEKGFVLNYLIVPIVKRGEEVCKPVRKRIVITQKVITETTVEELKQMI